MASGVHSRISRAGVERNGICAVVAAGLVQYRRCVTRLSVLLQVLREKKSIDSHLYRLSELTLTQTIRCRSRLKVQSVVRLLVFELRPNQSGERCTSPCWKVPSFIRLFYSDAPPRYYCCAYPAYSTSVFQGLVCHRLVHLSCWDARRVATCHSRVVASCLLRLLCDSLVFATNFRSSCL